MSLTRVVFWLAAVSILMPMHSETANLKTAGQTSAVADTVCGNKTAMCADDGMEMLNSLRDEAIAGLLRVKADLAAVEAARNANASLRKDNPEDEKT